MENVWLANIVSNKKFPHLECSYMKIVFMREAYNYVVSVIHRYINWSLWLVQPCCQVNASDGAIFVAGPKIIGHHDGETMLWPWGQVIGDRATRSDVGGHGTSSPGAGAVIAQW